MSDLGGRFGKDMDWESSHQFRQRYQIEALLKSRT